MNTILYHVLVHAIGGLSLLAGGAALGAWLFLWGMKSGGYAQVLSRATEAGRAAGELEGFRRGRKTGYAEAEAGGKSAL